MRVTRERACAPSEVDAESRIVRVSVSLFAVARQRVGTPTVSVELPETAKVQDLKAKLVERYPALEPLLPNLMIAIDSEYASDDATIRAGAEIAVIPPVSGGY
jgi:molybdopterin converting factor subunit 1